MDTKELEALDLLHYSPVDVRWRARPSFSCSPRSVPAHVKGEVVNDDVGVVCGHREYRRGLSTHP